MSDAITRLNAALTGRYAIMRQIGEGGMATVYLADDLRHQRKVALKVLRPDLAAVVGADRFLAEIKTTANLQHPHILPLFDSGQADSFLFYVMPYVEGETLRDRLDRDKQLPVDEALGIATAVANALQTAHDQGVVHRDIKPGNILLSRGEPLVADFGIALAIGGASGNRLTETGLSVGTPFYMSPEQATGDQAVGPASDTYALACVLYEMLIGEPPYLGNTAQAVLGKIIQGLPVSAKSARSSVPSNVDAAIRKALEKLPADRFTTPRDFAHALADPTFRHGAGDATEAGAGGGRWKPLALATSVSSVGLAVALAAILLRADPPLPVTRVPVDFPEDQQLSGFAQFDLSADGSLLVYVGPGSEQGTSQLWARRWEALEATPIRDTDGMTPFAISPDGTEVALSGGITIRVVPVQGGISRTVVPDSVRCCPRWSPDGAWLYYTNLAGGLSRVPATGGPVEVLTQVDTAAGDAVNMFVDVLPGGEAAVFEASDGLAGSSARVLALEVGSGEVKELTAGRFPRYSQGHLLFTDPGGTTLMAAPFDVDRLEIVGPERPVAEGLRPPLSGGWNYFAVSQTGSLFYSISLAGTGEADTDLVWVTRAGEVSPAGWRFLRGDGNYSWRLSPAGTSVALRAATDGNFDIWVKELPNRPPRRLTFTEGEEMAPWWTSDGRAVNYISGTGGGDVWTTAADGTGAPELFLDGARNFRQGEWTPDGAWLVLRTAALGAGGNDQPDRDLFAFRLGVDSVPRPLVATPEFAENGPAISPDGRWLAYASTETGRYEVWVRTFPEVEAFKYQVSTEGGVQPRWARAGRELLFVNAARELVAARFETDPRFRVVESETLFTLPSDILFNLPADSYDVGPDGRLMMARDLAAAVAGVTDHILVLNALEELLSR